MTIGGGCNENRMTIFAEFFKILKLILKRLANQLEFLKL